MDYTQHYQKKVTPQSEQADARQVPNHAGGFGFAVDDWKRLERFLILGAEGGTYYVGERELTRENAKCVERCLAADGARAAQIIAEVSSSGRAPKNDAAIFALALAASHGSGDHNDRHAAETRRAALAVLQQVCRTGTHLLQFVGAVKSMRGFGRAVRGAVGHWYRDREPDALAYQLLKYQSRAGWSHRDVLRMLRVEPREPGGAGDKHAALFRWVVDRANMGDRVIKPAKGETDPAKVRTYPAVGDLPRLVGAYAELCAAEREADVVTLVDVYGFTHEMVPSKWKGSASVWEALADKMPLGALIRNLGKLTEVGVVAPLSARERSITDRISDAEALRKARVHPVAVLLALRTYAQGHGERGSLSWKPSQRVVDGLDAGFYNAFTGVEPTGKRTLIAVDTSTSMTSRLSGMPLSAREGAAAMAMVTARSEALWHAVGFTTRCAPLAISPRQRMDDVVRTVATHPCGGTDCAQPMEWALKNKVEVDAFLVYTDAESWAGSQHPHQALEAYRQKMGIAAKYAEICFASTHTSTARPDDAGSLCVAGFDAAVPNIIADHVRT